MAESINVRCAFLFRWPYNPYLELLATELRRQGVEVFIPDRCLWFARLVRKPIPFEIVHLQEVAPFCLASSRLRSVLKSLASLAQLCYLKATGVRIVWTAHDLKTHWKRFPTLEKFFTIAIAEISDAIIVHCRAAKSQVCRHFRIRKVKKVFAMPHGNYIEAYPNLIPRDVARDSLGLATDVFTLLCFGLIRSYKGFKTILEAFTRLPRTESHLLIVGKPFDAKTANSLQSQTSKYQNVTLIQKFVVDADVQLLMNACDAVIFGYEQILTSGVLILAMSFGKACIAPNQGCIPETLAEDGGLLYQSNSADDLYDALRRALNNKNDLASMGARNKKKVEAWSWEVVAKATLEVYRSILTKGAVILSSSDRSLESQ